MMSLKYINYLRPPPELLLLPPPLLPLDPDETEDEDELLLGVLIVELERDGEELLLRVCVGA
jgi:hypothetical protein